MMFDVFRLACVLCLRFWYIVLYWETWSKWIEELFTFRDPRDHFTHALELSGSQITCFLETSQDPFYSVPLFFYGYHGPERSGTSGFSIAPTGSLCGLWVKEEMIGLCLDLLRTLVPSPYSCIGGRHNEWKRVPTLQSEQPLPLHGRAVYNTVDGKRWIWGCSTSVFEGR